MNRLHGFLPRVLGAIWWLALVAWVAAIIAPAAAAMTAFPRLPELEVAIPSTQAFFADDPNAAGRFVAGYVTNPIFLAADSVRLVVACLLGAIVLLSRGRIVGRGPAGVLAIVAVGIACVLLAISLTTVATPLAEALELWRTAVFAGDHAAASTAKAAFDPLHERASTLMTSELGCVLVAIALAGAASASSASEPARQESEA
jgi:hypothetical protein